MAEQFGLYLSCVDGAPVARYGTSVLIGAERDAADRTVIHYHPEVVVAIPTDEARRYAREYRRAIADGSVKERTAADWQHNQIEEAGAPRSKLTADEPPEDEAAHGDSESSSKQRQDTRTISRR